MFNMKPGIDLEVYADMYEEFLENIAEEERFDSLLEDFYDMLLDERLRDDTALEPYNPDDYNILPF